MNLKSRVAKLEQILAASEHPAQAETFSELTEAQRVQGLRNVWAAVHRGNHEPEPFADLEGKEYMAAFWRWFLNNGEFWPDWAKEAVFSLGWPCDASGMPLPPEERIAQITRWWRAE